MKNEKMWKNKIIRKKVAAVAGVLLCLVGVGTFIAVQARRNTLDSVQNYSSKDTFTILEIVPTNANDANEEIGYFVAEENGTAAGEGLADFKDVSKAKSLGGRTNADSPEELQNFIDMRDYGLIKFEGIDNGSYNVEVSEHPVYSKEANFVKNALDGYEPMGNQFVLGSYKANTNGAGAYFLKEGYVIKEDGKIYKEIVETVPNSPAEETPDEVTGESEEGTMGETPDGTQEEEPSEIPEGTPMVSADSLSDNTLGDNAESNTTLEDNTENGIIPQADDTQSLDNGATTGAGDEENTLSANTIYEPVALGDYNNKQLPEGIEQRFDENGKQLMTGDVDFVADANGNYYGLTENAYYYYKDPSKSKFYNGDWFKEYVLGDNTLKLQITIDTVEADKITKDSLVDDEGQPKYDLIYVSGSYEAYQNVNVDLSEEAVMTLFDITTLSNSEMNPDYQAVIMDYALLGPTSSANPTNLEKLALLLWQQDQRAILSMSTEGLTAQDTFTLNADGKLTAMPAGTSNTWSTLGAAMNNIPGVTNGNFVAGSVYVYNHMRSYFKTSKVQIDAKDFFANGDFASTYADSVVSAGFGAVKMAVQTNNLNFADKRVSEAITPALVIQYILSYDGTTPTVTKSEIHILEIQPVRAFLYNQYWGSTPYDDCPEHIQENRDQFAEKFFEDAENVNQDTITFTSMTVEEFIGRNEDLNENYDMIYIGSSTTHKIGNGEHNYYYTVNNGKSTVYTVTDDGVLTSEKREDQTLTDFNDDRMDGMVYYNIGDEFYVGTSTKKREGKDFTVDSLLGILDDGTVYKQEGVKSLARFSGRDLTTDKKNDLIEFLDCGYPIVVAGDIMRSVPLGDGYIKKINPTAYSTNLADADNASEDHGRVDSSSELYEFLNYAVNGVKTEGENGEEVSSGGDMGNLISEADIELGIVSKEELAQYLNEVKLSLNITDQPVAYSYSTKVVNNQTVIDEQSKLTADSQTGKFYLNYEFTITNTSSTAIANDTYGVHLYVDVNADGKFGESEELADCTISNAVTGEEIAFASGVNGRIYALSTDVLYKLRREVPEGFAGILPWCLEVQLDRDTGVRASQIGYTQVPRLTTDKIDINILQVTHNSNSVLNLQNQLANPNVDGNYFGLYLSNLNDYNVTITTITQKQYEQDYNDNYLAVYDMLILGFGDGFDAFTSENAVNGLIAYIDSGRPVLLTHDLVMHRPGDLQTKMLRPVVGMDRYGVYDESVIDQNGKYALRQAYRYSLQENADIIDKIKEAGHRMVYLPGSNKTMTDFQTQGISNNIMVQYRGQIGTYAETGEKRYINTNPVNTLAQAAADDHQKYIVHNINEGQITMYPYILPDSFRVAQTHNQYYQLDMESDMDQDGETDVVVWYTLGRMADQKDDYMGGGSEYATSPNDVVNNYYIYNRGNITYSGVGHSKPASNKDEIYEAQLFVNTMIAAYRAGVRTPSVKVFETADANSEQLESLAVAYDKNVGKNAENGDAESSILRYEDGTYMNEFIDDGEQATKVYFQIDDPNFVKGNKFINARFFREDSTGNGEITLEDGTAIKVSELQPKIYTADFKTEVAANELKSGVRYGFYLPLSYLKTQSELKIYISAQTRIENVSVTNKIVEQVSNTSFQDFTVVKMDLLNLD